MMLRTLYAVLLRLHPKQFQARFGSEMPLIFEEARNTEGLARLVLDAVLLLLRQRLLRSHSNDLLPSQAGHQAGILRLSNPQQVGLSPYRFFQGGLISLVVFLTVGLLIRGGEAFRNIASIRRDAAPAGAQTLTPSDLATVHVKCPKNALHGCSSAAQVTATTLDEMMDFVWYPSALDERTAKRFTSVWNYSRANQLLVETHALEKSPIAKGSNLFPVLLFYPSTNSSSAAYTTQIENFVSHGYVVASLEPHTELSVVFERSMASFCI